MFVAFPYAFTRIERYFRHQNRLWKNDHFPNEKCELYLCKENCQGLVILKCSQKSSACLQSIRKMQKFISVHLEYQKFVRKSHKRGSKRERERETEAEKECETKKKLEREIEREREELR